MRAFCLWWLCTLCTATWRHRTFDSRKRHNGTGAESATILNVFEVLCELSRSMLYLTLHFSGSALSLLVNICSGLIWNSMMFPCLAPPRATQQTTQNPASASPMYREPS